MPIQAASGSPMSGSLANQNYETFGGVEIIGQDDPTFFTTDHPIYGQVLYIILYIEIIFKPLRITEEAKVSMPDFLKLRKISVHR